MILKEGCFADWSQSLNGDWHKVVVGWQSLVFVDLKLLSGIGHLSGPVMALLRWLSVRVSGHVKSHARHCPRDHGIVDILSGCLCSDLYSSVGSRCNIFLAVSKARLMNPLMVVCRFLQSLDFWQLRPWVPLISTLALQIHQCSAQTGALRRSAMAMCRNWSFIHVPTALMGTVCRNAPACGADTAVSHATAAWFGAVIWAETTTSSRSHDFSQELNGGATGILFCHRSQALNWSSFSDWNTEDLLWALMWPITGLFVIFITRCNVAWFLVVGSVD